MTTMTSRWSHSDDDDDDDDDDGDDDDDDEVTVMIMITTKEMLKDMFTRYVRATYTHPPAPRSTHHTWRRLDILGVEGLHW